MNPSARFWEKKKVLVTGHSGFKGLWLSLWLQSLGADVTGFSLPPEKDWAPRDAASLGDLKSVWGDLRDEKALQCAFEQAQPDVVLHLAAQPLVLRSYTDPIETFDINVTGLSRVLHLAARSPARVVLNVTSDKCYENKEWEWPYRETDPMGGYDPYSASKGCAELVTSSFYRSFFRPAGKALLSARAGNVVGGGDEAPQRIVPDIIRAVRAERTLTLRNPKATRPWQHVLEPVAGYLLLAERAWSEPEAFSRGWNIGPDAGSERTVEEVAQSCFRHWGKAPKIEVTPQPSSHEAHFLKLDSSLIRRHLGWQPRLGFEDTMKWTMDWYRDVSKGATPRETFRRQIAAFQELSPPGSALASPPEPTNRI